MKYRTISQSPFHLPKQFARHPYAERVFTRLRTTLHHARGYNSRDNVRHQPPSQNLQLAAQTGHRVAALKWCALLQDDAASIDSRIDSMYSDSDRIAIQKRPRDHVDTSI